MVTTVTGIPGPEAPKVGARRPVAPSRKEEVGVALRVTVVVVAGVEEEEESRDRLRHQSKRAKILSLEMVASLHDANVIQFIWFVESVQKV